MAPVIPISGEFPGGLIGFISGLIDLPVTEGKPNPQGQLHNEAGFTPPAFIQKPKIDSVSGLFRARGLVPQSSVPLELKGLQAFSDEAPTPTLSQLNALPVKDILKLEPKEKILFGQIYRKAHFQEDLRYALGTLPLDQPVPLKQALGMFPSELQESLAPLAEEADIEIELKRGTPEMASGSTEMADALTGAALFASYHVVIRKGGVILNGVKNAPMHIKNGIMQVATNPNVPVAAFNIVGLGMVYFCLDHYLAEKGVETYKRIPIILGTQVTANVLVDAGYSVFTGAAMPTPKSYVGSLMNTGNFYMTGKVISYGLNEFGIEYGSAENIGLSIVGSLAATPGLNWGARTVAGKLGLARAASAAAIGLNSLSRSLAPMGARHAFRMGFHGLRRFGLSALPLAIKLIGEGVAGGFFSTAGRFVGKGVSRLAGVLTLGLMGADIYYAYKDGTAEGEEAEFYFAQRALVAEQHSTASNIFFGGAWRSGMDTEVVLAKKRQIKSALESYAFEFDYRLKNAVLDYFSEASSFDRASFAKAMQAGVTDDLTEEHIAGLKSALEVFYVKGGSRVSEHINEDSNGFDGDRLAETVTANLAKDLEAGKAERRESLNKYGLAKCGEDDLCHEVTQLRLGELSSDARDFVTGASAYGYSRLGMLELEILGLRGVNDILQGRALALSEGQKEALN